MSFVLTSEQIQYGLDGDGEHFLWKGGSKTIRLVFPMTDTAYWELTKWTTAPFVGAQILCFHVSDPSQSDIDAAFKWLEEP